MKPRKTRVGGSMIKRPVGSLTRPRSKTDAKLRLGRVHGGRDKVPGATLNGFALSKGLVWLRIRLRGLGCEVESGPGGLLGC